MAKSFTTNKSGSFQGKSNSLGQGGRAAQMKAHGVPGGVIGEIARAKGAAPGQKNFHRTKKRTAKLEHSKKAISGLKQFTKEEATEKAWRGKSKKRATDDPNKNDADKIKQDVAAGVPSKSRKAKRPIEQQPKALALEKEPDVVATPNGKKVTEGFRKRKAHRAATKTRGSLTPATSVPASFNSRNNKVVPVLGNSRPADGQSTNTPKVMSVIANSTPMLAAKRSKRTAKRVTSMSQMPIQKTEVAQLTKGTAKRSMPQRRTHRTMSGMDMLNKATKRK